MRAPESTTPTAIRAIGGPVPTRYDFVGMGFAQHRIRCWWLVVFAASVVLAAFSPVAARAEAPTIVRESVSRLSRRETRATLKARIDPRGLETKYEFWINYQPCLYLGCELLREDPELRGQGHIAAGERTVTVRARLTGLFGDSYEYWVVASNSDGTVKGPRQDFPPS